MMRAGMPAAVVALVLGSAVACVGGDAEVSEPVPSLFDEPVPTARDEPAETEAPSTAPTTTAPVAARLPDLADEVAGAVRAEDGTARAVTGTDGEVWFTIGACSAEAIEPTATAALIGPQHVVIDPGRGGADRGTTRGDLVEAELNLDIARRVADRLTDQGVAVVLTRDQDTSLSNGARGALGPAVGARALVSIRHPVAGDETTTTPRPAVFHQIAEPESLRLGALVHEELADAFGGIGGEWAAIEEPGVKPLLNQRGEDFFVVLQRSAGTPAVVVDVAALGENEATLLTTEEGRSAEAAALAEALVRFLVTDEQGSGVTEPSETVRTAPTSNTPGGCTG